MKYLLVLLAFLSLASCKNDLPVSYKICDAQYKDCEVVAKFKSMELCQEIKERMSWHCNTLSKQSKADCDTSIKSIISASVCSE